MYMMMHVAKTQLSSGQKLAWFSSTPEQDHYYYRSAQLSFIVYVEMIGYLHGHPLLHPI